MTGQKLRAGIKWKQNERFASKELFVIVRSQTSKGLILGLKNKNLIVVMKEEVLEKTCCNFYNKLYKLQEH
jgi:hypothetical protein